MKSLLFAMMLSLASLPMMAAPLVDIDFSSEGGYDPGTLGGQLLWTTPSDATSAAVIASGSGNPPSPVGSDQMVYLAGAASSSTTLRNEYIFTDAPLTAPFSVDIWMMRTVANSLRDSYFNLTSQSSPGNGAFAGFDDDRFFYQKIGNDNSLTTQTYTLNTWYRFHLEVDPAASAYNLTIYDGSDNVVVPTLSGLQFRGGNAVSSINVLRLSQLGGSSSAGLYVGSISVNVIPEPGAAAMGAMGILLVGGIAGYRRHH